VDIEMDKTQKICRIIYVALVIFVLGIVLGCVLDSIGTFGIFSGIAVLVAASTLLLADDKTQW
jgi:hypothetical protein